MPLSIIMLKAKQLNTKCKTPIYAFMFKEHVSVVHCFVKKKMLIYF